VKNLSSNFGKALLKLYSVTSQIAGMFSSRDDIVGGNNGSSSSLAIYGRLSNLKRQPQS
jgi:hypothetical protein